MADLVLLPSPRFSAGVRIEQGPVRQRLEDAWTFVSDARLGDFRVDAFAVFDGLGGEPNGLEAATAASGGLKAAIESSGRPEEILPRLNERVLPTRGATTAVIALFDAATDRSWIVAVGDSAAYGRGPGLRPRLIVPRDSGQRGEVGDYLGNPELRGHAEPLRLARGENLLLVTDGVDGVIGEKALAPLLSAPTQTWKAEVDRVFDRIRAAGMPDNATLLIVRRA